MRASRNSNSNEFPLLAPLGLYAAPIQGNGNCLFNALSDQLYGHQGEHGAIRARVIEYMREKAHYYKQFIDVNSGGGTRRNPKRKNTGAFTSSALPTADEIEQVFQMHLTSMAKGGTYGDNMEIAAFAASYKVDVKIHQRDFPIVVAGGGSKGEELPMLHIAYHTWEHYSSVRKLAGPHTGLPEVTPLATVAPAKIEAAEKPVVADWMIEVVMSSLPYVGDRLAIKRTLEENKGNVDAAVSKLLHDESSRSGSGRSSMRESSSVERDQDNDEEALVHGPNKKQDRRLSRATRTILKGKTATSTGVPRIDITLESDDTTTNNGSVLVKKELASLTSDDGKSDSEGYSSRESRSVSVVTAATTADDGPITGDIGSPSKVEVTKNVGAEIASGAIATSVEAVTKTLPEQTQSKQVKGIARPIAKKRVTAREKKEEKKAVQKTAAKQQKRTKAQAASAQKNTTTTTKVGTASAAESKQDDITAAGNNDDDVGSTNQNKNSTTTLALRMGKDNSSVMAEPIKSPVMAKPLKTVSI